MSSRDKVEFSVKEVKASEGPKLLPLVIGYRKFYEIEYPEENTTLAYLEEILISDDVFVVSAVKECGEFIGFASAFSQRSTVACKTVTLMNDLFVCPYYRDGGIGSSLIGSLIELSRRKYPDRPIKWETQIENKNAQSTYDKITGIKSSIWKHYSVD